MEVTTPGMQSTAEFSGVKPMAWYQGVSAQKMFGKILTTVILAIGSIIILTPLVYMISISLKDKDQLRQDVLNPIPYSLVQVEIDGKTQPLYNVTIDGETREMVMVKRAPRGMALFADPTAPDVTYELLLADQSPVKKLDIHWGNYREALTSMPFDKYLGNTLIVTFGGMIGMLFSCSLVAYGFSRFRAPFLNVMFLALLSTIMLPNQVRLIPIFIIFQKIGWVDTLLPLIIPMFFANAYDVFLLRQFFMTIPLDQDEAAKLDGASPFQVLLHVILPQSKAALVTVAIFHFLYAWNDFYEPLIYLHSRENWTMALGLQTFNALYSVNVHLIMAVSFVMILPPIVLFFFSQRIFMQGVVISGSKG